METAICNQATIPAGKEAACTNETFTITSDFAWEEKTDEKFKFVSKYKIDSWIKTGVIKKDWVPKEPFTEKQHQKEGSEIVYKYYIKESSMGENKFPKDSKPDIYVVMYSKNKDGSLERINRKRKYNYSIGDSKTDNDFQINYIEDSGENYNFTENSDEKQPGKEQNAIFLVNGRTLSDGDVMKVGKNGRLQAIHPNEITNSTIPPDSTIFMNGMGVDQRQMLDYANHINKTGGQDVYMVANASIGAGVKLSTLVTDEYSEGDLKNVQRAQRGLSNKEIYRDDKEKEQLYDSGGSVKNDILQEQLKEKSIDTMVKLLKEGRAKNILSYSQGSLNVSVALGIAGKDPKVKRKLRGTSWTSVGGAYSERNIYELPEGLDVHLYYNERDNVSRQAPGLAPFATNAKCFRDQERNKLANDRKEMGDSYEVDYRSPAGCDMTITTCAAHNFTNYTWGIQKFFGIKND